MGIGTWGLGGFMEQNPDNNDQEQIDSLTYTINKGVNYMETVYMYAQGKSVYLLAKSIKKSGISRDKLFITLSIYPSDAKTITDVRLRVEDFLRDVNIGYVDNIQLPMNLLKELDLEEISVVIKDLLNEGKVRFTSITNSDLEFLKKYHSIFGDKLFAHEVVYNFEIRENEKLGITKYADENGILNIVYQPLRRNRTAGRNWELLVELAEKYGKTQNQIVLNWIVSKGFLPLVKSTNKKHIDENLDSFNFVIEKEDIERLNNFQIPGYETPKIDWNDNGDGIKIDQLPNRFDDIYPKDRI